MALQTQLTFKFHDLLIDTQVSVKPCSQKFDINLLQKSYIWPQFLCELRRVFTQKDWSDLSSNFNGIFFVSPYVQVKYKRTSTIVKRVVLNKLECILESLYGDDNDWLVEEVSSDQSLQEPSINILKDGDSSSKYSNAEKTAEVPRNHITTPIIEDLYSNDEDEDYINIVESDSDQQ